MMFGSNRRRASEFCPGRILLGAGLLLSTCLLLSVGLWVPAQAATAGGTGQPPQLELSPSTAAGSQLQTWLDQDRVWLSELPLAGRAVPEDPAARRRWVQAWAGADTAAVVRTVDSLLRDRWIERGFLAAGVTSVAGQSPNGSSRQWVIDPGPRFKLGQIQVDGPDFEGREHLLRTWLPAAGDDFLPDRLAQGIDRILAGAGEAGYPFARWVTSEVSLDEDSAEVRLTATLLPGNRAVLGPVTSNLPAGRAGDFLARASGLRPGQGFRQSEITRAVERLVARDLYAAVGTPRIYPTSSVDTVGVHFPVTPRRKVNRLQVVLGLSRRQEDQPSRLSGEVDFRLPNMAGSGRGLGLNWRDDGAGRSHFGLDFLEPLALGTPLDTWFGLDSEVQADSFTRLRLDNRWQLPVVALWGVELGWGWDRSTYPTGELERTSRVRARGAFLHRRGDRARSGWWGSFAVETARRSTVIRQYDDLGSLVGSSLGAELIQRIYEVDAGGEIWLGSALSLAGRSSFRQLSGSGQVIPLAEQFRFGGAATLRGYQEDEFHGAKAAWGGVEVRIGPPGGSRLYTFFDLGYFGFSSQITGAGEGAAVVWKEDWPRGYGLGILAKTTAGDISLAVGFPGTVDFDLAKLHVTLMESF